MEVVIGKGQNLVFSGEKTEPVEQVAAYKSGLAGNTNVQDTIFEGRGQVLSVKFEATLKRIFGLNLPTPDPSLEKGGEGG